MRLCVRALGVARFVVFVNEEVKGGIAMALRGIGVIIVTHLLRCTSGGDTQLL